MAGTIIVKTNAASGAVLIPDLGVIVPTTGGSLEFVEFAERERLQGSTDLRTFLEDDAFGAGSSTLILNDGTSDIAQSEALVWLDAVIGGSAFNPVNRAARDSVTSGLIYIGRSNATTPDPAVAEWQIYRYDGEAVAFTPVYAGGVTTRIHIWDNREALTYP